MSDLGSHSNDLPFWALKLKAPLTIEAKGPPPHPEIAPATMSATYEYGPRGDMPAVKLTWYQGEMKPAIWKENADIGKLKDGTLFIGEKGMLVANYTQCILLPKEKFADFKMPTPTLPRVHGKQYDEWIKACKEGKQCLAELRVFRLADRGEPPWQRRLSRRQEARMGRRRNAREERTGGGEVHPPRVSQGVGAGVKR